MGFSIRRSFKLGPLGRVYLGKKGASLSVGGRGAHVNFGPRGTRMTVGMLGPPVSFDETVLRGKNKRTYKYRQLAKNRFGLRVFLENDIVCGWDEKDEQQ